MKKAEGMEIWAHRGMFHGTTVPNQEPLEPARFGENTVPALRAAAFRGFSPEFDVMATLDGHAIVAHGDNEGVIDNGTFALRAGMSTLEELQRFGLVARTDGERHLIPTLGQVMDVLEDKPVRMNIELKGTGSAKAVIRCLHDRTAPESWVNERLLFSSFEPREIREFRDFYRHASVAWLLWSEDQRLQGNTDVRLRFERFIADADICALHVDLPLADEGIVEWAAKLGLSEGVRAYTCNSAEQAIELHARGIAGIFTDFPEVLFAELS